MAGRHSRATARLGEWLDARLLALDFERTLERRDRLVKVRVGRHGAGWANDVAIERDGSGRYSIAYGIDAPRDFLVSSRNFVSAYLYWMDLCGAEVRRITVNASDGQRPSLARFSPSVRSKAAIALPDPHFYLYEGFAVARQLAAHAPAWSARTHDVVWRGGMNGAGAVSFDLADQNNAAVIPRLRLCMKARGIADSDVRLAGIGEDGGIWTGPAVGAGLSGGWLPEPSWLHRKFAIDIDGVTNTWSNLFVRMLFGCCVFKVESQLGYRQWYYDRIKPFEHFVPVRSDMSDLAEKVDWARGHADEARSIAENAQHFAMSLDFEAGKRDAVDIITANWDRPGK